MAALAGATETFEVTKGFIDSAWKQHIVAGIVLDSRSNGGETPIYSHHVAGTTSLYGYPVGFNVNITATSRKVTLDIAFDPGKTTGPLPENVRFEMDSDGRMTVTRLPAAALEAVENAVAFRQLPCALVLGLLTYGLPL